jgi:hypothetical protein
VERKVTRAERRRLKEERRRERLERGEARRGLDASARDDVRDVHRWMPDGHRDGRGDHGDRQERRPRGED